MQLYGDDIRRAHEFELLPGLYERFGLIQYMVSDNTTGVTTNQRQQFELIKLEYAKLDALINEIIGKSTALDELMQKSDVPYIRK